MRRSHCAIGMAVAGTLVLGVLAGMAGTAGAAKSGQSAQRAQAKKGLLTRSDLPKGWTPTGSVSYGNGPAVPGSVQLAHCLGVPTSVVNDNAPTANSPIFHSKNELELVGDSVSVYPSAQAAKASHNSLVNAKAPSCLSAEFNGPAKSLIKKAFGQGGTLGHILITRTQLSNYAPGTANYTMFFPVTSQGTPINVEVTTVDFVHGNEEQALTLVDFGSTFPVAISRQLTKVADGRI